LRLPNPAGDDVDVKMASPVMSPEDAMKFVDALLPVEWISEGVVISRAEKRAGFVYFIRVLGTEYVKVGYSRDVLTRLSALQTGSPIVMQVELLSYSQDARSLEHSLHKRLRSRHVLREWFNIPQCFDYNMLISQCNTENKYNAN
jgi:hypothetical protein